MVGDRMDVMTVSALQRCCVPILVCWTFLLPANARGRGGLTPDERQALDSGELVVREKSSRRGELKMIGGQSWQLVNVSQEDLWKLVRRTTDLDLLVPGAVKSEVIREDESSARVRLTHEKGVISVTYDVDLQYDKEKKLIMMRVDPTSTEAIRAGWGFLQVRGWSNGRTLLSFGAMTDIGDGMLAAIIRPAVQTWMLKLPSEVKRYAERP